MRGPRGAPLEPALAARLRTPGDDHPVTPTSLDNLAETLRARGDEDAAQALEQELGGAPSRGPAA